MGVNVGIICGVFFLLLAIQTMGVEEGGVPFKNNSGKSFKKMRSPSQSHYRSIDTGFKFPNQQTATPPGTFASKTIDLGGLQVTQVSAFFKTWGVYEGSIDGHGISIYEPNEIPNGYSMLGSYAQPNGNPLFGWVLVAKDVSSNSTNSTLKPPLDYTLVWTSASMNLDQDTHLYLWLPTPPDGYKALGYVATMTDGKPGLDKMMCVRSDFTDQCESFSWMWGINDFHFYNVRPSNRGPQAPGVQVGTFVAQNGGTDIAPSISCLKNLNPITNAMPNITQLDMILKSYSPFLYLHSDEEFLPSSVDWLFSNGALLYKKGQESNPIPISPNGANLPQDPNSDGAYWIDLPADDANRERVKAGNLSSATSYVHVKPMLGGTFTDLAMWVFYPFNGPGRAKVEFLNIKLGKIGEHIGDWEHVTLRVSNFDGQLYYVYFSEHNKGRLVDASLVDYQEASDFNFPSRRPIVYSSLHGHATYPHGGLTLLGGNGVGVRDDCDKGANVMDMAKYELVSAEYLGPNVVVEPPWLNFFREWGPHIDYSIDDQVKDIEKFLPWGLKQIFEKIIKAIPKEVFGEEGPTGPKVKNTWNGDEIY